MIFKIDRTSSTPIFRQIISAIKTLIEQGSLPIGRPLPPTRTLAQHLGVNRSTVYQAYAELQALGYLESRPGSYNIVQLRQKEVSYDPRRRSAIPWAKMSSTDSQRIYRDFRQMFPIKNKSQGMTKMIDMVRLEPDPLIYPLTDFRRCINLALLSSGPEPLQYGNHQGYPPLCQYISQRMRLHGVSVSADEILITNGAQQAIDLTARLLGRRGGKVVVEMPTYSMALPLLKFNGLEIVGVAMTPNGLDLEALEKTLQPGKVAFIYTMPNFHNPTGITTTHSHREQLLQICLKYRVPLVEDGFEEEMKYLGRVDLPIKSIDEKNIVIYLGTFSKTLFPGMRIGWVTADRECIQRLIAIKRFSDLTSSSLVQMTMHRFCQEGYYDRHLKKVHRIFRKRMQIALQTLEQAMPRSVSWTRPLGGYTIWVRLPKKLRPAELRQILNPYGVQVSHGGHYFPRPGPSEYFRISIASLSEADIREGIARLGRALQPFREAVK